jgi:hypothetical protein
MRANFGKKKGSEDVTFPFFMSVPGEKGWLGQPSVSERKMLKILLNIGGTHVGGPHLNVS